MSVGRLLREVIATGGDAPVSDLAKSLGTSETVVYNLARELRVFGVVAYEPNRVRLSQELLGSPNPEEELRLRVISSLRRHRAFSTCVRLLEQNDGSISQSLFAAALPGAFPAVAATGNTWLNYARSFAQWFDYTGLAHYRNKTISSIEGQAAKPRQRLLADGPGVRRPEFFPQRTPGPATALIKRLWKEGEICIKGDSRTSLTSRDLLVLGIAKIDKDRNLALAMPEAIDDNGDIYPNVLRSLIETIPGCKKALDEVERDPTISNRDVGEIIKAGQNASWSENWTAGAGKALKSWARTAGLQARA